MTYSIPLDVYINNMCLFILKLTAYVEDTNHGDG